MPRMLVLNEYKFIFFFFLTTVILGGLLMMISYILSPLEEDGEKLSSYECGFDPYEDARNAFDVRFYLVAILFLLFDVETALLFPWSLHLHVLPVSGHWLVMDFVFELVVGFVYAWQIGALDWE